MLDALGGTEDGNLAGEGGVAGGGSKRLRGDSHDDAVPAPGSFVDGADAHGCVQLEAGQAGEPAVAFDRVRFTGGAGEDRDVGAALREQVGQGQAPGGRTGNEEGGHGSAARGIVAALAKPGLGAGDQAADVGEVHVVEEGDHAEGVPGDDVVEPAGEGESARDAHRRDPSDE